MSAAEMTERIAETSPRFTARIAGAFYLLMIPIGGLADFARRGLVVKGDAVATATNILAHEPLFRLGFAGDLLVVACYVAVTALLYDLLKPVNRSVSLLAAFFSSWDALFRQVPHLSSRSLGRLGRRAVLERI